MGGGSGVEARPREVVGMAMEECGWAGNRGGGRDFGLGGGGGGCEEDKRTEGVVQAAGQNHTYRARQSVLPRPCVQERKRVY